MKNDYINIRASRTMIWLVLPCLIIASCSDSNSSSTPTVIKVSNEANKSEAIQLVKEGSLSVCPNSNIEQVINNGIASPSWKYDSENGDVSVSGDIYYEGHTAKGTVQFHVDAKRKTIQYSGFKFAGFDYKSADNFFEYICPEPEVLHSSDNKPKKRIVEKPQVDINKIIRLGLKNHLNPYNGKYYKQLSITSLQGEVIIQDVVVNRGNCAITNIKMISQFETGTLLPLILKFGESYNFGFVSNCENILEAEVHTNKGNGRWTFN